MEKLDQHESLGQGSGWWDLLRSESIDQRTFSLKHCQYVCHVDWTLDKLDFDNKVDDSELVLQK